MVNQELDRSLVIEPATATNGEQPVVELHGLRKAYTEGGRERVVLDLSLIHISEPTRPY